MKPSIKFKDTDDDIRVQVLLKECELCSIDANHIEDIIWTATGILITASIAGIGFLSGSGSKSLYDILVHAGVAVLSIFIIWRWEKIVTRWYKIQELMYARVEEIEQELGMFKNRYITALDDHLEGEPLPDNEQIKSFLNKRGGNHKGRIVRKSIDYIKWVLIISWGVFFLMQPLALIFTFVNGQFHLV